MYKFDMKTKLKNVLKISSQIITQVNTLENQDINTSNELIFQFVFN